MNEINLMYQKLASHNLEVKTQWIAKDQKPICHRTTNQKFNVALKLVIFNDDDFILIKSLINYQNSPWFIGEHTYLSSSFGASISEVIIVANIDFNS